MTSTSPGIEAYARSIDILWNAYTAARREHYATERRWPDAPIWQRRRGAGAVASQAGASK